MNPIFKDSLPTARKHFPAIRFIQIFGGLDTFPKIGNGDGTLVAQCH